MTFTVMQQGNGLPINCITKSSLIVDDLQDHLIQVPYSPYLHPLDLSCQFQWPQALF